jgi:O-acetyl-ADP-ribose deacetylase (regulator of RNase III)
VTGLIQIEAMLADITTLAVGAIVNAANNELAPGGGVCGAIHRAAGPQLARACSPLAPCPTGEARITPGFKLPARFVIHAVGPIWRGGQANEPALLASAYRFSLELARDHGAASVAFPAISTGVYGYPLRDATAVAAGTVRSFAPAGALRHVIFACFNEDALRAYAAEGIAVGR